MARARSPNSIEAEEMYKNGMKLVDIAKKLDVPASTVRRWKSTQNWDGKTKGKKNERSQKKKANARHKGGQPGNRNAVGNKGGPLKPGDKIAEKHGAYSAVYWDVLDESEKDMIEDIPMDEEMLLIEQIQLFAVRERRIMIAINKYRSMKGEVSLYGFNRSESKRTFKTEEDKQLYEERIEKKISAEERLQNRRISIRIVCLRKATSKPVHGRMNFPELTLQALQPMSLLNSAMQTLIRLHLLIARRQA